jgi:hypothetical protein
VRIEDNSKGTDEEGRIILKCILRKYDGENADWIVVV